MSKRVLVGWTALVIMAASAVAQTNVTTTNGGTAGTFPVFTSGTNVENSVITQSNGNVGIGTTSTGAKLDVQSGSGGYGLQLGFGSGGASDFLMSNSFYSGWGQSPYAMTLGALDSSTGQDLFLITKNTNIMTGMVIKASGSVGIGTPSPQQALDVDGNVNVDSIDNSTIASLEFEGNVHYTLGSYYGSRVSISI
ncbi:MAG: hypothetical protein ABSD59_23750 [Terracidiphilus sp.]|jgi:hypothetical protein